MRDLPDSNLDALFKKAADSVEFEFDERNWNAMDKRLDYHSLFTRLIWTSIIGIFLIAVGITLYTINSGANLHRQNTMENKTLSNFTAAIETEVLKKYGEIKDRSIEHHSSGIKINHLLNLTKSKSIPKLITEKTVKNGAFINSTMLINGIINIDKSPKSNFSFEKEFVPDFVFSDNNYPSLGTILNSKGGQKLTRNYFSLNINLGMDISGVNFSESGLGSSSGIGLEYFIANKFSIATGINYVKKKYSVSKGEYYMPDKYKINYNTAPGSVNVSCDVIDIPINFYYALTQSTKGRLSIGGGCSSYLMISEVYRYNYGIYNSVSRTLIIKNENQHYFGVMNLSIAYAGWINHKFSWQIEPYYKIPLTKIATAEVNLNTIGFNLMLKYKL